MNIAFTKNDRPGFFVVFFSQPVLLSRCDIYSLLSSTQLSGDPRHRCHAKRDEKAEDSPKREHLELPVLLVERVLDERRQTYEGLACGQPQEGPSHNATQTAPDVAERNVQGTEQSREQHEDCKLCCQVEESKDMVDLDSQCCRCDPCHYHCHSHHPGRFIAGRLR